MLRGKRDRLEAEASWRPLPPSDRLVVKWAEPGEMFYPAVTVDDLGLRGDLNTPRDKCGGTLVVTSRRIMMLNPDQTLAWETPYKDVNIASLYDEYSPNPRLLIEWFLHGIGQRNPCTVPNALGPLLKRTIHEFFVEEVGHDIYDGERPQSDYFISQPSIEDASAALAPHSDAPQAVVAVLRGAVRRGVEVIAVLTSSEFWVFDTRWRVQRRIPIQQVYGVSLSREEHLVVDSSDAVLVIDARADRCTQFVEDARGHLNPDPRSTSETTPTVAQAWEALQPFLNLSEAVIAVVVGSAPFGDRFVTFTTAGIWMADLSWQAHTHVRIAEITTVTRTERGIDIDSEGDLLPLVVWDAPAADAFVAKANEWMFDWHDRYGSVDE